MSESAFIILAVLSVAEGAITGLQRSGIHRRRTRPQQKFDTESALAAQIAKDCKEAKTILAAYEAS
ncbi:MAG: hypothetical protein ISS79_10465 [Phycisphaerae bacterium]|nr:hypothetical protein [Phycisphaerae bacterium]